MTERVALKLGLRENLSQFSLLVLVNAFVGAMVGMERSILPAIAEDEFRIAARTGILAFIVVFGVTKATANYFAGTLSDIFCRRTVLIAGWLVAAPTPFLLMWAPSWNWILVANAFLGVSQGLTWSTTVIMKIDLAGPERRGLAMGVNEFAGYVAVALAALATGFVAANYGLRPEPFYLGVVFVVLGLALSVFAVKPTKAFVAEEARLSGQANAKVLSQREIFVKTSVTDPNLSSVSQAGLVNNLNDGMAWGLFPIFFAAAGMSLKEIGALAAIYPAVWGFGQLITGAWSDRVGRKRLIVSGMWVQAMGIGVVSLSQVFSGFVAGAVLLGMGTAMVYPTLLASIGDVAHPSWRASSVGVYRLWRDLGYAFGALIAGIVADMFGMNAALWAVAGLTFASGLLVYIRMSETLAVKSDLKTEVKCISVEALAAMRNAGRDVVVIDVRSPKEYEDGHIEGAVNVPVEEVEAGVFVPKGKSVVTACGKGGGRSDRAAAALSRMGVEDVHALCGGTNAWLSAVGSGS